jgi:hypothetical protein
MGFCWWTREHSGCAFGLPLASVLDFRENLSGPDSKVFLDSGLPERDDGEKWTVQVKEQSTGNPKPTSHVAV